MKPAACLIALCLLAGCTKRGPYRTSVPVSKHDTRIIEDHGTFKLGFIEFGDDGKRLPLKKAIRGAQPAPNNRPDRDVQLNLVLAELYKARGLNPATVAVVPGKTVGGLTIIFAHGWKNNAQSIEGRTKDVEKFRAFLADVAVEVKPAPDKAPIPVTGVYLGWHGRSVNINSGFLNWWSLWPRYFAAGRVGSQEMQTTIARVIQAGVAGRGTLKEDKRPRVILIGHSLGARVLENALQQVHDTQLDGEDSANDRKLGLILGQCKNLKDGNPVKSVVDLTLLVNEAAKSRQVRAATKACHLDVTADVKVRHPAWTKMSCPAGSNALRCQPYPLFVHITTTADWATRFLAPVALLGRTAPHTSRLWTHRVNKVSAQSTLVPDYVFKFQTQEEPARTYAVTRVHPNQAKNPVWVMRVDNHVMKSHGDIWNESFQNMIKGLMGGLDVVDLRNFSRENREQKKR